MKRKIKRKIFTLSVILQIFIISGLPNFAEASIFGFALGGSATGSVVESALKMFGVDTNLLRPMTETSNVFQNKGVAPEVNIVFSGDIRPGGKIKALAQVNGIINPDTAYYTWYIKRGETDDVDEWKKLAIIENKKSNSSFNPLEFDQVYNGGNGDGVVSQSEWAKHEKDDDGYVASNGGDGFRGAEKQFYYVYDKENGKFYELGRNKGKLEGILCDEGYVPKCMITDNSRTCPIYITPLVFEFYASASGGSGGDGGDGGSGDGGSGGSGGSSSAGGTAEGNDGPTDLRFARCIDNGSPRCTSEGVICPNGGDAYCVPDPVTETGNFYKMVNDTCPSPQEVRAIWEKGFVAGAGCDDHADEFFEAFECDGEPSKEEDHKVFTGPNLHLFPIESYNSKEEPQPYGMPDGSFDLEAEMKFEMNPENNRTVRKVGNYLDAKNDEAFVVGLGVKELTWTYQEGDEVGVVVEGLSPIPTKHEDSTYQAVFAFMSNGCKPRKRGAYEIKVGQETVTIETSTMDTTALNNCLRNNLVKPGSNESRDLEIDITIGTSLETAITNNEGNIIEVNAQANFSTGGSTDSSNMNYLWSIKCGSDSATVCDEGLDVSKEMADASNLDKIKGNNLSALKFQAEFPAKCFDSGGRGFACIDVKVNSPFKQGKSSFGTKNLLIPIQKSGGKMKTYSTTTDGNSISSKEEICSDDRNFSLCRVVPGEIIKVEMPIPSGGNRDLVSWYVNGVRYNYCNSDKANECFFPVVYPIGDYVNVSAVYSDQEEGNFSSKTVSRNFVVVKPQVFIKPVSGGSYKVLGKFINESGKEYPDESKKIIEYTKDNSIALEAVVSPRFASNNMKLEWSFNGGEKSYDSGIQFVPDSSNINLKARHRLSQENLQILNKKFGVSSYNFPDFYINNDVSLDPKQNEDISQGTVRGFFATTANNTPEYFIFVLKTFLIISSMLFISHLFFSLVNYGKRY